MCNWSPLLHLRLRTKFILQHHLLPAVNTMEIQHQKRQENKHKVVDSTIQFRVLRSSRVSKRGIKRDARGCATTSGPDNLDTVKQKSCARNNGSPPGVSTVANFSSKLDLQVESKDGKMIISQKAVELVSTDSGQQLKIPSMPMEALQIDWTLSLHGNEAIATATKHLMEADAKLKAVIEWHDQGPQFEQCTSCFLALARSIVCQQLAPKAAHSINTRLVTLCEVQLSLSLQFPPLPPPIPYRNQWHCLPTTLHSHLQHLILYISLNCCQCDIHNILMLWNWVFLLPDFGFGILILHLTLWAHLHMCRRSMQKEWPQQWLQAYLPHKCGRLESQAARQATFMILQTTL